ncbi:MAG: response regulator transcription factor [Thermaerobacter sp.]|nr:response regulator transcription factor [Thermaerobacter sp.]
MARVLLVDDDEDVQTVLGRYLEHDGHVVQGARTGQEALDAVALGTDVVVLDLTLPDLDGLEVLRRLRSRWDVPILVLTARGEEADRLLGLGLGADDYVVKPFSPREICLRAAALLRRRTALPTTEPPDALGVLRRHGVEVHPEEHRVLAEGREVLLTPREFDLLLLFLRRPGRVFSRTDILLALWPDGYVSEHVVDVHLASLRRKLGAAVDIVNVRGVGYRLTPERAP